MCILFLSTSTDPAVGEYKLVLAANRDESYGKPSKVAHFWLPEKNIVGGQDLQPGREGGTWLGMSRGGKIGALLNMPPKLKCRSTTPKLGRGFLVNAYLSSDVTGHRYGRILKAQNAAEKYHSFNLLTIDLSGRAKENGPEISYFSNYSQDYAYDVNRRGNGDDSHCQLKLESNRVHSFGNCTYTKPFLKVKDGQREFERLIRTYGQSEEEKLVDGLLRILKSKEKHYPDPAMSGMATARSKEFAEGISSRFVHIPWKNYGSRTHTIILVDRQDRVKFLEWTMMDPILDATNPIWMKTIHEFSIVGE